VATVATLDVLLRGKTGPLKKDMDNAQSIIGNALNQIGTLAVAKGMLLAEAIKGGIQKVIGFAIFSTRRLEEITRILWKDLDLEGSRVLVRDMKNPGEKIGNHVWCELPAEAMRIVLSMPKRRAEIFPYCGDTIGTNFTRACQLLEIIDLHFHDLRHDGVSRLFEIGRNIPQVAAVSGHRSWSSLKRYTHLRQTGDKYAGWKWFSVLTSSTSSVRTSPKCAFTEDLTTGWLDPTARG